MQGLYKSTKDKKVDGVLGGLAEYFKVDSSLVRILFVLFTIFFAGFPGVIIYFVFAMLLPTDVELEPKNVEPKNTEIEDDSIVDLSKKEDIL